MRAQEIVRLVIAEAVGSSLTPFVPLPWVDDILFERLLRRVAGKVLAARGIEADRALVKSLVDAYVETGKDPLAARALVAAGRFVLRKVAMVLDVKKSHDVFGEVLAFALALDMAAERKWVDERHVKAVGEAVFAAVRTAGGGPLDTLARSARGAFGNEGSGSRLTRATESLARELDTITAALEATLHVEGAARGLS